MDQTCFVDSFTDSLLADMDDCEEEDDCSG